MTPPKRTGVSPRKRAVSPTKTIVQPAADTNLFPKLVEGTPGVYVFNLVGQYDAEAMGFLSRLENTPTGIRWTVQGELARALLSLEIKAEQRGVDAVMGGMK